MASKICAKCKKEKELGEFGICRKYCDGRMSRCLECSREDSRIWQKLHRSPEQSRESCRKWRESNPKGFRASMKKYRLANLNKLQEKYRKWRIMNKEKCRSDLRQWHKNNPDKYSEYNKKRRSTLKGKLNLNISTAICNSLKDNKNGWHWEELVGYTLEELKCHLEKQFADGMSWENYGLKGWTIDHRIPIKAFNFETPEDIDFKECWKLRNLRPLWHVANMSKKDSLVRPHQPSLLLQEVA